MDNYMNELISGSITANLSAENNHIYIEFGATVRPIYLNINDQENPDYNPKCTAMVLDFGHNPQDVGEIYFKNYYTYTVSILVKKTSNIDSKLQKWYIALKQKKLMDSAHSELRSQDYVCIKSSESEISWSNVYKFKLILSQPSSNWIHFGIDDVKVVKKVQSENVLT